MSEANARRLVDGLLTVLEEVQSVEKKEAAAAAKLSAQEIRALSAVGRERGCFMTRIADAICLSLSSATGLIDRLVDKKLVRRDRSAQDRRVVHVELTDEGRQIHAAAMESRLELAHRLLADLDADEQKSLVELIGKVSAKLKARR